MAHFHKRVTISGDKSLSVRMLVDTGTTYSVVSKALARAAGITPLPAVMMTLADGRRRKLRPATAILRVGHREAPATVLVGDVAEPILGVEALDVLGLALDPRRQRLTPTRPYTVRLGGYR